LTVLYVSKSVLRLTLD